MRPTSYLSTILMVISTILQKAHTILNWISSLVFVTVSTQQPLTIAVVRFLWEQCYRIPIGGRTYGSTNRIIKDNEEERMIAYEILEGPHIFLYHGRPLFVRGGDRVDLGFFRFTFHPDTLVQQILDEFNMHLTASISMEVDRFDIYYLEGRGHAETKGDVMAGLADMLKEKVPERSEPIGGQTVQCLDTNRYLGDLTADMIRHCQKRQRPIFHTFAMNDELQELYDEFECWLRDGAWYRECNVPWTRGWKLDGRPGTGKTTFVVALAERFRVPIFILDLTNMTNSELRKHWKTAQKNAPCIILLEDLDRILKKEEEKYTLPAFSTLLNCIQGAERADGVFLVITANDGTVIDSALDVQETDGKMSRPGRIDRAYTMTTLDHAQRTELAYRMMQDLPAEEIRKVINTCDGYTAAQFVERCGTVARKLRWETQKEKCHATL